MSMCFVLLLLNEFPLFSKIMELLLSWRRQLSLTFLPYDAMKYWFQQMAGMKLSTPTISVSVEFHVLSFCFVELTIGNPRLKDKTYPECTCILGWTANDASTHHLKIKLSLALRVSESLSVPLMYCIRCTNLSQSYSSVACTLVIRNVMDVQVSGLALLVEYKLFTTRLWKFTTFHEQVSCSPRLTKKYCWEWRLTS